MFGACGDESAARSAGDGVILVGDCRETMRTFAPASVQCVVTSPPYFALRDYGSAPLIWPAMGYDTIGGRVEVAEQSCSLGLERSPNDFVGHTLLVFDEIHRVLKDDGTVWLNIGDSYSGSGRGGHSDAITGRNKNASMTTNSQRLHCHAHAKSKDMLGIPWMLAFALRARGWYLRQDIIWHKPNTMPESAKDRCTKAHEYLFLLAKSERYYFDQGAIEEQASVSTHARMSQNIAAQKGSSRANGGTEPSRPFKDGGRSNAEIIRHRDATRRNPNNVHESRATHPERLADEARSTRMGRGAGWRDGVSPKAEMGEKGNRSNARFAASTSAEVLSTRNKRSVWTIPTQPFSEAHFATFPEELVKPCILAGSRLGDTVLDPFLGSGTVGQVAIELGRAWIGCELQPKYLPIAEARTGNAQPGLIL